MGFKIAFLASLLAATSCAKPIMNPLQMMAKAGPAAGQVSFIVEILQGCED